LIVQERVFFDTSFVIALENLDDPYHLKAREIAQQLFNENTFCFLHWGILLEIGDGFAKINYRLAGTRLLQKFLAEKCYLIAPITDELLGSAIQLYQSRADKEFGLTDCLSFTLMRQEGIHEALTADHHFQQEDFRSLLLE
jgi:uncharacterized protein